jgi:flagellar FliJ protein
MAKRFRFRLDVVERVRRQDYDRQRRTVAEAVRAVRQIDEHMARINEQIRRSVADAIAGQRDGALDLAQVRSHEIHRGWLNRQLANAELARQDRERALKIERSELAEVTKRLRVIEKLREKQWRRHLQEVGREEQMMSDEMALTRFLRVSTDANRSAG